MAAIPRTPAVLRRFSAVFPGIPMPTDSSDIPPGAQLQLLNNDPELHQLLSGAAPAELELQVITGTWAEVAPTQQQRQEQANAARIAELVESLPFGTAGTYEGETYIPGQQPNITAQMELQALAPELAAQLQTQAAPPAPAMHPGDAAVLQRFGYSVPTAA